MTKLRWLPAVTFALALVAASCGDDGETDDGAAASSDPAAATGGGTVSDGSAASTTADHDPEGVLRIATPQFARLTMTLDEQDPYGTEQFFGVMHYVFGSLLSVDAEGEVVPYLAESYEIVDDSTMTLTLRDGLTFQDGHPYDAETIADIIMNTYKPFEDDATFDQSILRDIESVDVVDPLTLQFNLSRPVVGLLPNTLALGQVGTFASPDSTPDQLYGAGPYQIVEFVPEDRLVVEKWDEFVDADDHLLGGIEWLNIPTIEAAQNALEGGQVDLIATNPRDVDALVQRGPFESVVTNNQGHYMVAVCQTVEPFDDARFREAFDLALNRERINEVVFGGHAEPMESLWNPDSPYAVAGLIDPDGDPERAREILDEIGWDGGTTVQLGVFPGFQTHQLMAEVMAAQLDEVGISTSISTMEGYDWQSHTNPEAGGIHITANTNVGIDAVRIPGASEVATLFNPCSYSNDELMSLTDDVASGTMSSEDEIETWQQIQELVVSDRAWFTLLTQPAVYVYDTERVQGVEPGTMGITGATVPQPFLDGVSVKAG